MGSLESENREKRELDDGEDVPPAKRLAQSPPEERQCVSLLDLSDDVLLMILNHCTPIELKAVGFTCERLAYLIQDHTLWHRVDARDVPYGRKRFHWLLNVALSDSTKELKLAGFAREPIGKMVLDHTIVYDEEENYNPDEVNTSKSTQTNDTDFESFSNKPLTRLKSVTKNISSPGSSEEQACSSSADPMSENKKMEQHPIFTFTREMLSQLSAQCKNLTLLYLEYCNINNVHTDLGCFPRTLKELSLKGTRIYNVPFEKSFLYKAVDYLDSLEYLDVSECNWMEGHVLLSISKMSKLKTLIMRNCLRMYEFVAYASLAGRYGFKQLQVLDVRGSPFCDSELTAFGWLPVLQEIYLAPRAPRSVAYADENTPEQFPWEAEEPECFQVNYYKFAKKSQEGDDKKGQTSNGQDGSSANDKAKSNKDEEDKDKEYNKTVTFWQLMCDSIETTAAMQRAERERERFHRQVFLRGGVIADRLREIKRAVALQAGRRPDGPQDGRRPDGPQDGRRPDGPQDGRRPDGPQDGRRPDGPKDGRRPDGPQDGRRPDGPQDGRRVAGQQDGRPVEGQQDGTRANGSQDGRRPDGPQDGRRPDGPQDGRRVAGQQDGRPVEGQQDGTRANGSQDGRRPDGPQDGRRPDGPQDGRRVAGQQDGRPVEGQQDGTQANGSQDGKKADGSQDGKPADGHQDGTRADVSQDGKPTDGQQDGTRADGQQDDTRADVSQDGKPADGTRANGSQDGKRADGSQDVKRADGQHDGRGADGQKDDRQVNGSQDAKRADGQQDDKPKGKRADDGPQEGSKVDGQEENKQVDSQVCGEQTSRQQNGAQSYSRQDGELVDRPNVIVVDCQESAEQMVRQKIGNEREVSSQQNDGQVIDESDDKQSDHKQKVLSNGDQNAANSHQPQPGPSQSNDANRPGTSKGDEDDALKGSKRKIENESKEVTFKRQCPVDIEPPQDNSPENLMQIIQAAWENHGYGQNLGPRNNNMPRNLPRNRVLYVNFGRQIPSLAYRIAIEGGVTNCTLSSDCPRLRSNRLNGTLLVSDSTVFRFGRSNHEIMNLFPLGRPGNRQVDQQETGGRPNRSSLRILSVTGYRNITDRSLHHLASSAPNLRLLDLSETNVTDTGVEAFKVMQPNCEVKYSKFKQ